MQARPYYPQRRSFFKKLVVLSGSLALSPLVGRRSATAGRIDASPQSKPSGYHMTAHIRKYYKTAAK